MVTVPRDIIVVTSMLLWLKTPDRKSLREEGLVWVDSFIDFQSLTSGKAWRNGSVHCGSNLCGRLLTSCWTKKQNKAGAADIHCKGPPLVTYLLYLVLLKVPQPPERAPAARNKSFKI